MNKTFGFALRVASAAAAASHTNKRRTKNALIEFNNMPSQQNALPGAN
jgi:hypothetical protein|tara:strand:- start:390 stop:533 length:144 start_codon:yes stop_codon:yes gene_type:complete